MQINREAEWRREIKKNFSSLMLLRLSSSEEQLDVYYIREHKFRNFMPRTVFNA